MQRLSRSPRPYIYYQVTCQEISNNEVQAVWLGNKLVWEKPLREITWSTKDISLVAELGDVIQFERTAANNQKEKLRARVISVTEIR